jgi:hypothetical protein
MTGAGDLALAAAREVVDRHVFFERWFAGCLGEVDYRAAMTAFDAGFARIDPAGAMQDRAGLDVMLRGARGRFPSDFSISVDAIATLWEREDAVLMSYLEHQRHEGRATSRRAAALFLKDAGAPHGVAWRFVQETWINDLPGT